MNTDLNAAEQEIWKYLQWLLNSQRKLKSFDGCYYHGPADLLVSEGRWYRPSSKARLIDGVPQACFRNAAMYSIRHRMRYVEGIANLYIPTHHAWCVDDGGNVYEVTWDKMGTAYFGVEFKPFDVLRGPVLFNHLRGLDIFKNKLGKEKK